MLFVVLFLDLLLIFEPRVPRVNFIVGLFSWLFSLLAIPSTGLPVELSVFFCVFVTLMGLVCVLRAHEPRRKTGTI
jgi:hypothetical protein